MAHRIPTFLLDFLAPAARAIVAEHQRRGARALAESLLAEPFPGLIERAQRTGPCAECGAPANLTHRFTCGLQIPPEPVVPEKRPDPAPSEWPPKPLAPPSPRVPTLDRSI